MKLYRSRRAAICVATVFLAVISAMTVGCKHQTPEKQAQADFIVYQNRVREIVKDPALADQLIALTDNLRTLVHQRVDDARKYHDDVATLNANYDATRAQFDVLFKEDETRRQAFLKQVTTIREQMGALTTDNEWAALRSASEKARDAYMQELNSSN